jgi:hypothetical protein
LPGALETSIPALFGLFAYVFTDPVRFPRAYL